MFVLWGAGAVVLWSRGFVSDPVGLVLVSVGILLVSVGIVLVSIRIRIRADGVVAVAVTGVSLPLSVARARQKLPAHFAHLSCPAGDGFNNLPQLLCRRAVLSPTTLRLTFSSRNPSHLCTFKRTSCGKKILE